MKNWFGIYPIYVMVLCTQVNAQPVWDTTAVLNRHGGGQAGFKAAPRIAVGYSGAFVAEFGWARTHLLEQWLMNNVSTKYAALQWTADRNAKWGLWAAKAGGEIDFAFIHIGLELMAQTDWKNVKGYIVPNAGLTWRGTVGVAYYWLWPVQKKQFIDAQPYQVMLKYNTAKKLAPTFRETIMW
jgi:hypothetical protein